MQSNKVIAVPLLEGTNIIDPDSKCHNTGTMVESTMYFDGQEDAACSNLSRRRCRRIRSCSGGSSFKTIQSCSLPLLLIFATIIKRANAGLSFGGATNENTCYSALEKAQRPNPTDPTEYVVDKDGYVTFVQEMSDDAFTSLQKNDQGEWGMFPTTDFDKLPTVIKGEFWTRACGGPNTICATAWLVTDGADGSKVDAQQTVTLFQVCKGVEDAIKEATGPKPTPKPVTPPPVAPPSTDLPQCTPLYEPGMSYDPGTLVSNQIPGAPAYSNYQCIVGDGRCSQAQFEPGKGAQWPEVWKVYGDCNLEISQPATPTPPPSVPTPSTSTCPPLWEIGTAYGPGALISNRLPLIMTNGETKYVTYQCKPLPEGNWCQQPAYEPGKNNEIWRQAWDEIKECTFPIPTFPDPPTYSPTGSSPTAQPVEPVETYTGDLVVKLVYHALMNETVNTTDLQDPQNPTAGSLAVAMTTWAYKARSDLAAPNNSLQVEKSGTRMLRTRKRGGRELVITQIVPVPDSFAQDPNSMQILDVGCSTKLNSTSDNCIQVATNLTLKLQDEPMDSVESTKLFFEQEFERDLQNGEFYEIITKSSDEVNAVYPPSWADVLGKTENGGQPPSPNPATEYPDFSNLIGNNESQKNDDKGGTNVAGIVSGVVVGLVVVGLAFFVYRRRRNAKYDDGSYYSKDEKKRSFDPANDLEGGESSSDDSSKYSEFSSSNSQSSASMASYSGSESRSSGSSSRSSSSSYSSKSGSGSYSKSSRSSYSGSRPGQGGPVSVSASESDSYSSGNVSGQRDTAPPLAARNTAGAIGRGTSSGSESSGQGSGGVYSTHDDTGSSIGDASDPAKQMAGDGSMGSRSRGSRSSASRSHATSPSHNSHSSDGYHANVDLMDSDAQIGSKGTNATPTDDDSSAGSSGWDSSDGESSVDTGSVDSYDPNTIRTGDFSTSAGTSYPTNSSSDEYGEMDQDPLEGMINPAVNPVVQHGVTMLPIEERLDEDMSSAVASQSTMDTLDNLGRGGGSNQTPLGGDIQDAIEKGDWAAVGATAAILASSSGSGGESVASSDEGDDDSRSDQGSRGNSTGRGSDGMEMSFQSSAKSDEDDMRAAEIDALVETGNWDGVVAVAARYADEADEADQSLGRPANRNAGRASTHDELSNSRTTESGTMSGSFVKSVDDGSVSVEAADDGTSVYSNTTRDSFSHTTNSRDGSFLSDGGSTMSGTNSTPPDQSTLASSSITSSYVSKDNITSSMVSAVSTVDPQEKRQMNAYRAEVEALVRRVVPDEIDNVDDIMVQFSGREEELIETLRAMQEKSIAQRARAAVQRSAKKEAGARSRDAIDDDDSTDFGQSVTTDGGETYSTNDGQSYTTGSYTTNSRTTRSSRSNYTEDYESGMSSKKGSITEQFTQEGDDDFSSSSRTSSSGSGSMSSYTSVSDSRASDSEYSKSIGVISVEKSEHGDDIVTASPGLSDAIDASDWRAVGQAAEHMVDDGVSSSNPSGMTGMSRDTRDELDDMIDTGDWDGIIGKASNMSGGNGRGGGNAEDLD